MPRLLALLLALLLVGCGGALPELRPDTRQSALRSAGMEGSTPVQGQSISGEGLGQPLPRTVLRSVPRGATTAAEVGSSAATGEALVAGGSVVAAAGSVVLVCLTVRAAADGVQTPLDIADTFYGTHFGDVQGWVQGCYVPMAVGDPGVAAPAPEATPESGPAVPSASGQTAESHEDRRKKRRGRVYATYTKFNVRTGRSYSGRTSMVVDLSEPLREQAVAAVLARDSNHHIDENNEPKVAEFLPDQLDVFDAGTAVSYHYCVRGPAGKRQSLLGDVMGVGCWSGGSRGSAAARWQSPGPWQAVQ